VKKKKIGGRTENYASPEKKKLISQKNTVKKYLILLEKESIIFMEDNIE